MQAFDDSRRSARTAGRPPMTTHLRGNRAVRWGRAIASGLAVCLVLTACGGGDSATGSDGKAREVRCAR
jgi:hypothetical protein